MARNTKKGLSTFESGVMRASGYQVDSEHPENVKYEVAREVGVPLHKGYNGDLTSKQAGKVGGNIGGPVVRETIKIAEKSLSSSSNQADKS